MQYSSLLPSQWVLQKLYMCLQPCAGIVWTDECHISQREILGLDFPELGAVGGPQALLTKKGLLEMLTSASRLLAFAFFPFDIFRIKQWITLVLNKRILCFGIPYSIPFYNFLGYYYVSEDMSGKTCKWMDKLKAFFITCMYCRKSVVLEIFRPGRFPF